MTSQKNQPAITSCHCLRCGFDWYPRKPGAPKRCANKTCRSPYWNIPRRVVEVDMAADGKE